MLRTLMITTAASALMIGGALAQTSVPAPATTTAPSAAAVPGAVINAQKADQWLASKFKGTDVLGPENEKVGNVSDILFDKNGQIQAYIVSVGGFLGMGAKEVALPPSSFQAMAADSTGSEKLKLSMTKDQLQQAANFEPYNPPRTTTGSGSSAPAPVTPAPRPSTNQ